MGEVGLRQEGDQIMCWQPQRPQLYIGEREGVATPLGFQPQGVRLPSLPPPLYRPPRGAPALEMGISQGGGGQGGGVPPKASGVPPRHPRVSNPRHRGTQGGRTSPLGAGPLPHLAHAALWGRWPHLVDSRDPPGGPGTLPITPETFPVTKTGLPIYKSLPPDHSWTPCDIRDLIEPYNFHIQPSITTYNFP